MAGIDYFEYMTKKQIIERARTSKDPKELRELFNKFEWQDLASRELSPTCTYLVSVLDNLVNNTHCPKEVLSELSDDPLIHLETFCTILAHRNTPLSIIVNYANIVEDSHPQSGYAESIYAAILSNKNIPKWLRARIETKCGHL